ncbi:metalloregulator ArsR/SmtB family transcription factor [Streptomyces sp. 4503]|uniref:Metalloregulator ArsR/SmtB family transcription factor n=1 Tax=Streptomyces niphimycinicus TaxID=2842201 RepID=A0ABS6CB61_9ACTN|nr:metalloregulator ArsR/SmtB family transcription factor [Streptomyces niphimycinicus]
MTLWDRLKDTVQTMQAQLTAKKNDLRSGAFRDASMAMCALVAAADGTIDLSERQRVAQLIATNDVLQNFPPDELHRRFEDHLDALTTDFALGMASAMREIGKAKRRPAEARAVIQIGIVIGCADGYFDDSERDVVREACSALDIPPTEFDLHRPLRVPRPYRGPDELPPVAGVQASGRADSGAARGIRPGAAVPGDDLQVFLKALTSGTRQRLFAHFIDGEELTVGEVAERTGLGPSTTSEHLAVLRRGGLLQSTRSGKLVRYRADREGIAELLGQLHAYLLAPSGPQDPPLTRGCV